jgi:hypothetical protein
MTHSNHRRGSRESLEEDYVILVRGDLKEKENEARKAVEILTENNPVGIVKRRKGKPLRYMTNWDEGLTLEEIAKGSEPPQYVAGVFKDKKDVLGVINDLSKADLGFSIVVSGIFDIIKEITSKDDKAYLHTMNLSMETIGRTELLPEEKILELITMCGHSLVSPNLAKHLINEVRKGRLTADEAGRELGKQCVCNFFNQVRAAKIIQECVDCQI